jgi:SAGA-associated factor 29
MSRNRPRPRDNGFGNNEELELWTKICQDIRKSKEKFDQQTSLSLQIKGLVDKIAHDGNRECSPALDPSALYPPPQSSKMRFASN